jgi:hypothetical protein
MIHRARYIENNIDVPGMRMNLVFAEDLRTLLPSCGQRGSGEVEEMKASRRNVSVDLSAARVIRR